MTEKLDRLGRSELHYAVIDADPARVSGLIRSGAELNRQDRHGWTPLHFAAQLSGEAIHQKQAIEIATMLLDAGALVDPRDGHGNTPLGRAVFSYNGSGELIQLLRGRGADPVSKNTHGVSPFELARRIANYDVAKYFADLGN